MLRQILKLITEMVCGINKIYDLLAGPQATQQPIIKEISIDGYLDVVDVSNICKVSKRQVQRWQHAKTLIPDHYMGRRALFRPETLDNALKNDQLKGLSKDKNPKNGL